MATSLAHELNEAVTDPLGTGWYFDNNGDENAVSAGDVSAVVHPCPRAPTALCQLRPCDVPSSLHDD